jgi:hypothetical protein
MIGKATAVAAFSLAVAACAGPRAEAPCYDCGPCGMVGAPIVESTLWMGGAGRLADGRRAIRIGIMTKGACSGVETSLAWDGTATTLAAVNERMVDDPAVRSSHDGAWSAWTEPPLAFSFTPVPGSLEGTLKVVDAGKTTVLRCRGVANVVSCAP